MKIEGYEEINEEEHLKDSLADHLIVYEWKTEKRYWFKKVQKFPIVFENEKFTISINELALTLADKRNIAIAFFRYDESFPLLVKAVEKAKEIIKQNKTKNA